MHVVKSRWLALAALCLSLSVFSGCQIESSTGMLGNLQNLRIEPDLNLQAEPDGFVYELWILSFEQEIIVDGDSVIVIVEPGQPVSCARFHWDPYLYAASDESGNFLPLTLAEGMELPFDPAEYFASEVVIGFLTLEPEGDNDGVPDGANILVSRLNTTSGIGRLVNPFQILTDPPRQDGSGGFGFPPPAGSFALLSQSNKKGTPHANWRDNQTEGLGIWFAQPTLRDNTTLDSINCWDAYTRTVIPQNGDAYLYAVWIHKTEPESSFSNFGRVLDNREPDFEFRDGVPIHAPGRFGPSQTIFRPAPQPPLPGVQLGTDPVLENGIIVGYRYIVTTATGGRDTCIIRIDDPSLTKCASDTFAAHVFTDTTLLPKAFRISGGDTAMTPTLGSLLDLSDMERLNAVTFGNGFIFIGWEYEAWLIFTDDSGIPPMSLGKFKSPLSRDRSNPYTFTDSRYDENFHFPGEDFLQNLSSHHPSLAAPLDVIHDPRAEKIWITLEPDSEFGLDWAPDEPYKQFIYLSGFLPNDLDTAGSQFFPLVHRDINPSPQSLNEGNFFPTLTMQFLPAAAE